MDRVFLDEFVLRENDYKHLIRARRLKENNLLEVVLNEELYLCKISSISKDSAELEIVEKIETKPEYPKITLYQAILEKKKMEIVFKICTALGVHEFVPIITDRMEFNKIKDFDTDRNNEILKEAAQQSKGLFIPKIKNIMTFEDAIQESKEFDNVFVLYENEEANYLKNIDYNSKSIALFIGPEGGISDKEINYAKENGIQTVRLFSRILRAELAAFSAVSIIKSNLEEYES